MSDKNLLIVEDDEVLSNTLSRRLTRYGFCCHQVFCYEDVLLSCRTHLPQVVLLDMHLGEKSALNLIKPMRNLLADSRIILITGYASIATAVEAIKKGADDYLAKPIDSKMLLQTIEGSDRELANAPVETLSSEQLEWEHLNQVLKLNDGNVSAAARQLSMHRRTLQRKLKKRPSFQGKN